MDKFESRGKTAHKDCVKADNSYVHQEDINKSGDCVKADNSYVHRNVCEMRMIVDCNGNLN